MKNSSNYCLPQTHQFRSRMLELLTNHSLDNITPPPPPLPTPATQNWSSEGEYRNSPLEGVPTKIIIGLDKRRPTLNLQSQTNFEVERARMYLHGKGTLKSVHSTPKSTYLYMWENISGTISFCWHSVLGCWHSVLGGTRRNKSRYSLKPCKST